MSEQAKAAIATVLRRIQRDPRVAYYICPMTDTYDKLVAAHCDLNGLNEEDFRNEFEKTLKFEDPTETA